jgi:hypothetical protein
MNYCSLLNEKFQNILSRGEVTVIQRICSLPFSYFCEKKLIDILFPTIISVSYSNDRNLDILNKEINLGMITMFLKEKIQLEPIIEEEEMEKLDESREEINFNMIKLGKDQFKNMNENAILQNVSVTNADVNRMKKRAMSFSSTASSTKSCHDMLTGVSDYIPLYHRFPRNLWDKALDYYAKYAK